MPDGIASLLALFKDVAAPVGRVLARLRPDHATLASLGNRVDTGGHESLRVHVACAPDRGLRRPPKLDVPTLNEFAAAVDPALADELHTVTPNFARFSTLGTESTPSVALEIHSNGLVELLWDVVPETDSDSMGIPLLAVRVPIERLTRAASTRRYTAMFGRTWWLLSRRLDWFVNVSPAISDPMSGYRTWDYVIFPGREPAGRGKDQRPFAPPVGLIASNGRSVRLSKASARVPRLALTSFLEHNGYWDVEAAVTDALPGSLPQGRVVAP